MKFHNIQQKSLCIFIDSNSIDPKTILRVAEGIYSVDQVNSTEQTALFVVPLSIRCEDRLNNQGTFIKCAIWFNDKAIGTCPVTCFGCASHGG